MNISILLLSLLIIGDHFNISNILFFVFFFLSTLFLKNKINKKIILPITILFFSTVIFVDNDIVLSLLFILSLTFLICLKVSLSFSKYSLFTIIHLFYGFFLFFETIFTNGLPLSTELFCFYKERSTNGCFVSSYYYDGYAFPRMYSFASEPASYGRFLIFNIYLIFKFKLTDFYKFIKWFLICLFLTFSFQSMILILLLILISREFRINLFLVVFGNNKYQHLKNILMIIFLVLLFLSFIFFINLGDVFIFRTVDRFFEIFTGKDLSSIMRTILTIYPLIDFLSSGIKGLGIFETSTYISSTIYTINFENQLIDITGQPSNALIYLFISFGFFPLIILLLTFYYFTNLRETMVFFIFLFFASSPITPIPFIYIYILSKKNTNFNSDIKILKL